MAHVTIELFERILFWTINACAWIFLGYAIYIIKMLNKNKHKLYFQLRGVNLIKICVVFSTLHTSLGLTFFILSRHLDVYPFDTNETSLVIQILYIVTLFGILDGIVCRIHWFVVQINKMKMVEIQMPDLRKQNNSYDTDIENNMKQQTEKIKGEKYYSAVKLGTITIVVWFIEFVVFLVLRVIVATAKDNRVGALGPHALFAILNIIAKASYILYTTKNKIFKFNDEWFIKKEFTIYGKLALGFVVLGLISIVIHRMVPAFTAVLCLGDLVMCVGIPHVMVVWVHKKNRKLVDKHETGTTPTLTATSNADTTDVSIDLDVPSRNKIDMSKPDGSSNLSKMVSVPEIPLTEQGIARGLSAHSDSEMKTHAKVEMRVCRLNQFWNENFDKENEYSNVSNAFGQFIQHCIMELCLENLLFWINYLQLCQFLIENKYLTKETNNVLYEKIVELDYKTSHYIQDARLIKDLKSKVRHVNNYNNDGNNDQSIFEWYYKSLFCDFVENSSAPFEINISHQLNGYFTHAYDLIVADTKNKLDSQYFIQNLFPSITEAAGVCYQYLLQSFNRFYKKKRVG